MPGRGTPGFNLQTNIASTRRDWPASHMNGDPTKNRLWGGLRHLVSTFLHKGGSFGIFGLFPGVAIPEAAMGGLCNCLVGTDVRRWHFQPLADGNFPIIYLD